MQVIHHLDFVCVLNGYELVLTDQVKSYIASDIPMDETFLSKTPMKRIADISDVVKPVLFA